MSPEREAHIKKIVDARHTKVLLENGWTVNGDVWYKSGQTKKYTLLDAYKHFRRPDLYK